ncbi:tetratricopeptide repeat protein [Limimaricola soesokkakensis]|uniref:tetratricopeptide repeat protein n=1 Tax=Limimaricola soesokkakensis TaxID=1343159 RepID=UPI00351344BB
MTAIAGCEPTTIEVSRNAIPQSVPSVPPGAELSTAMTAFESGNFGYSAKYFEMAAKKSPQDVTACLGLAASYDWLYRFDLSQRAYDTCGKIAKETFSYHNNLGFSYLLRGDYGKASVSFARARELRPADPVVETNLRILRDATSG